MPQFKIELVDSQSGDIANEYESCPTLEDLLRHWIEGNHGCDCNRSILLWKGAKELPCNNDANQIKAYLILDNQRILLNDIDEAEV